MACLRRRRTTLGAVLAAGGPPLAAAVIGAMGSRRAPVVYSRLDKPRWAPPGAAFGPAWTALYAFIGVAGWRMWDRGSARRTWVLHGAQLTVNAAWPFTFFAARDKRLSLAVICVLDVLVAAQIADLSLQDDRAAAAALAPYLGWSLYATALNACVSDPAKVS
jgi:translocator protein